MLTIHACAPQALIQDHGRPGYRSMGISGSGAADRISFDLANRMVGNPEGSAGIECLLGGLAASTDTAVAVAVTGAAAPFTIDNIAQPLNSTVWLHPGQLLRLGTPMCGLRSYLAVRGGIAVTPVLGSRSTDTLSGIGPAPLAAGDRLAVGVAQQPLPLIDVAPVSGPSAAVIDLRARLGPRHDWVSAPELVATGMWQASNHSNRIGLRLDRVDAQSTPVRRCGTELPPEPVATGSIQIPPSGQPVVFLADHPVTGGYPVIAVLTERDIARAAQIRPGQRLRFHLI